MVRPMKFTLLVCLFVTLPLLAQYRQPNAAELRLGIERLAVTGSVLYIAAHPDDENTALLSYFARGRMYRTGYLSITRGEGGQNALGTELGAALGVIRTQELLAARQVDGAEQFFTRAVDFGYSKSADEALRLWEKDSVLKDVVFVIRKFRPDIIITRFSPTQGGHGHHLASAVLAQEAFRLAGEATAFPEQFPAVTPWKAKRILFNHFRFGGANSNAQNQPSLKIDIGGYAPLLGRSFTELAGIGRTMHKSQAMGSPLTVGPAVNEFVVTDGAPAAADVMEGVDATWSRYPGGKKLLPLIKDVQRTFDAAAPHRCLPALASLRRALRALVGEPAAERAAAEVDRLMRGCAALLLEARSGRPSYERGDTLTVQFTAMNRTPEPLMLESVSAPDLGIAAVPRTMLKTGEPLRLSLSASVPADAPYSQPYWLAAPHTGYRYAAVAPALTGMPEGPAPMSLRVSVLIASEVVAFDVPVRYVWVDDVEGERTRTASVSPPVSVALLDKVAVDDRDGLMTAAVKVTALRDGVDGTVRLVLPVGWSSAPAKTFSLPKNGDEAVVRFFLRADSSAKAGRFTAEAVVNGAVYADQVRSIVYPHIPYQQIVEPAAGSVLKLDVRKAGQSVGYIMGAGDDVPAALEQLGYSVTLLSDADLQSGDLSRFDAVVAGIRAYNVRAELRRSNARLLEYASKGGTVVVQYQVMERGQTDDIAPFPMEVSRDRVSDETAPVTFVDAAHPLLNRPNRITAEDFNGWVQERGLYFIRSRDRMFEPVLSSGDPGEKPTDGGLLAAKVGKGHYVYTGLSFFRQLPAGVPGAYRLLANILSIGR